jgi:sporulation protein YlmC with PRC-barrel domain
LKTAHDFDSHKPVSRQYEDDYYRYYGWPNYWQGDGLWGMSAFPNLDPLTAEKSHQTNYPVPLRHPNVPIPHLRSTQALNGYHIQTDEGAIGHVIDFIVDHETWAICHLVVETGHWFSGKEIVISPKEVVRISYDESKVFVSVTKESHPESAGIPCAPVGI